MDFSFEENQLIDDCLILAKKLTFDVSDIVREGYRNASSIVEYKQSRSYDVVTEYDRRIERFLINGIKEKYPNHKFLAEETIEEQSLTDSPTWIIDPIDGTKNYVQTLPLFAISIALAIRQKLVIGIVFNPILNEMYTARIDRGAYLNDKLIRCSNVENLNESTYNHEISFMAVEEFREKNIKRIYKIVSRCAASRCFGNTALTLAYVARGSIDCFQIENIKPWDIAAGVLLITEAGGRVYNTDGTKHYITEPYLACAGTEKLCQQLIAAIREADESTLTIK